jgi:DNA-binding beta-propeller fold protein YncE
VRNGLTSLAFLAAALLAGCGSDGTNTTSTGGDTTSSSSSGTGGSGGGDPDAYLSAPSSCAYECSTLAKCAETSTSYQCPALGAWAAIPHMDACPAWDGKYPAPVTGTCSATAPTGAALAKTGADPGSPGTRVLPDGRRIKPAGAEWQFDEADQAGGSTSAVTRVPGSKFVIAIDTGNDDHAVRAIDTTLVGTQSPVTGFVKFVPQNWLNASAAALSTGRVYVATAFGKVQALDLDLATGALTQNDAASLDLPLSGTKPWYVASVAASPDEKRLVVTSVFETRLFVFDIDPASATYKQKLGEVDLGEKDTFASAFDPNDPTGHFAYVTIWGGRKIVEIDLSDPAMPKVSRTFKTDKNPEGFAFLDARWLAVANDFGETISLVDRMTSTVTAVPVDFDPGLKGLDVSGLAYDPVATRLYATLAGVDAIAAYDVDLAQTPPALTPAGRLAASWWPTGMVVEPDGSLTVVNLRGRPIGPYAVPNDVGHGGGDVQMKGSVQHIPKPSAADLTAGEAQVQSSVAVGAQPGYPTLDCPGGAKDFPVPATNTEGPSPTIKHIIFIVRENKTYDSLFGDFASGEGDSTLTFKPTSAEMDQIWPNLRAIAKGFAMSDNFYSLAVKSTQGHHWTTYGRATDFCERTWSDDLRPAPLCGISDLGRAEEGSLFEWLQKNDVLYDILGEIVGQPLASNPKHNPVDIRYPGGPFQNITYVDLEKACYTAARMRVACDLNSFVYMTLPNDHTIGVSPDNPTPEVMCAVNDEATGMVIDAISHSPIWKDSLVVITEDDPQSGGDHVDYHRTPLVLASPWVKRGYVSKTHIDVASLHKLFAHILGLPYPNLIVKNAGLPLDLFTSTPDYTPYTYASRKIPLACGSNATSAEKKLTDSWDFHDVDEQPGLGEQVFRYMRGKQLEVLPPAMERAIQDRLDRKARGIKERDDD